MGVKAGKGPTLHCKYKIRNTTMKTPIEFQSLNITTTELAASSYLEPTPTYRDETETFAFGCIDDAPDDLTITQFEIGSFEVQSPLGTCLATRLEEGFELIDVLTGESWLTLDLEPDSIEAFYAYLANHPPIVTKRDFDAAMAIYAEMRL